MTTTSTATTVARPTADAQTATAKAASAATAARHRILSGMQPSADSLHLGNYIGALLQVGGCRTTYDAVFCVVDLHAITVPQDPAELREKTRRTAAQYIAGRHRPVDKSTLFVQSQVPAHAELAWVLNTITGFGEARRMTQFKDKAPSRARTHASVGPVHLPDPAGRRHPAVPRRHGARSARTSASTSS